MEEQLRYAGMTGLDRKQLIELIARCDRWRGVLRGILRLSTRVISVHCVVQPAQSVQVERSWARPGSLVMRRSGTLPRGSPIRRVGSCPGT
jgi:hypothetical protein